MTRRSLVRLCAQEALSCPQGSYPRRQAHALLASGACDARGMAYWRNAPRCFPPQRMLLQVSRPGAATPPAGLLRLPTRALPPRPDRRLPLLRPHPQGHTARVLCLAAMPDGATCASGSEDKTIRVWDLQSGETLQTLRVGAATLPRRRSDF